MLIDAMKICTLCRTNKPLDAYYRNKTKRDGRQSTCKDCAKTDRKKYHTANLTKNRKKLREYQQNLKKRNPSYYQRYDASKRREYHLKTTYGLTLLDYEGLVSSQKGRCAICRRPNNALRVDHDHKTGQVRGLLCGKCNTALGGFNDSVVLLEHALSYLSARK